MWPVVVIDDDDDEDKMKPERPAVEKPLTPGVIYDANIVMEPPVHNTPTATDNNENNRALEVDKVYPPPLVSHDEVIANPGVFIYVLWRFHVAMGTKFRIPIVGRKQLDLHLLYLQVTQRGGFEKVTGGKIWSEVTAAFNFPPTITSASFLLRKYYISLLHHFEQVYFFRLQGSLVPPAVVAPKRVHNQQDGGKRMRDFFTNSGSQILLSSNLGALATLSHIPFPSSTTRLPPLHSATIDGTFEHGYLVSVKMGLETLRGVLFHARPPPHGGAPPAATASSAPYTPMPVPPHASSNGTIIPEGSHPAGSGSSVPEACPQSCPTE